MWKDKTVSVILPTYRESKSIHKVIEEFELLEIVDEIIVVNNNAEPGTSEAISGTKAVEIFETSQGYGAAIKCGIELTKADLIVICEPDGTFVPSDLLKLLPFSDRAELVLGSRTVSHFIWSGANMGLFLKWGNWAVAKLIEVLFNTSYLSDVGCTFRVVSRTLIDRLNIQEFRNNGTFGMEFQLVTAMVKAPITQVPVNYHPRVGISGYTGNKMGAFKLGVRMIQIILIYRLIARRTVRKLTDG